MAYVSIRPHPITRSEAERRTQQFLHRWLCLVEGLAPNAEPFRALLQESELRLGFRGTGFPICSFREFDQWIQQQPERLRLTRHHVEQLKIELQEGGHIRARIDFDWSGQNAAGMQMRGKLRHEWELQETGEPYLRLGKAQVTILEPVEVQGMG